MLETLLQIVLGILAFLGITLLVILGLVLLVLLLVLFVPIRYNGEFIKDAEKMQAQAKVNWLLHFVRVHVNYEKELLIKAYVLFFKVYDSDKPAIEKKVKKDKGSSKEQTLGQDQLMPEATHTEDSTDSAKEEQNVDSTNVENEAVLENHEPAQGTEPEESESQKQSFIEKIKQQIQNIICKCKSICDKIKSIVQNINYYIEILKEEETKALLGRSKDRLFKVLKSIRPRKLTADLLVGTGSPDTTGYVMALAGMLYPTFERHVNITPDFEKTIFEGRIFLKGRITVFVILLQALKIFFDKELRKLLKRLKREDA